MSRFIRPQILEIFIFIIHIYNGYTPIYFNTARVQQAWYQFAIIFIAYATNSRN